MIPTKVLVTRYGGAGDMIMMEPALEALYYRHRPAEIYLRTHPHYEDLHPFHPLISEIVPGILTANKASAPGLPSDEKKPQGFDFFYNTTGCVEMNRGIHGMDSFAFATSAPLLRRTPVLYLDPSVPIQPLDIVVHTPKRCSLPGRESPRNADFRNYDVPSMLEDYFRKEGIEYQSIAAIGADSEIAGGLQEFARTIAGAKLFIGPDSAGAHIAAALSVPHIVAYTSAFPYRTRGYPSTIPVHDGDIQTLLKIAGATYRHLEAPAVTDPFHQAGNHAWQVGSRFMFGLIGEDSLFKTELTRSEGWRDRLREFHEQLNEGGHLFLYEIHSKYGGFDPVLLVKFMIESVGFEILEYTATADSYGYYYVAAKKARRASAPQL